MNFDEFVCAMLDCTKKRLESDEQADIQSVTKNNGTVMVGLSIRKQGEAVAPLFYLDGFYQTYLQGESVEKLADALLESSRKAASLSVWDYKEMFDFFKIKDKIGFKLVNTEKNKAILEKVPHLDILNLSLMFQLNITMDDEESGTILIRNEQMKMWKITASVLYECAKENMLRLYPAQLCPLKEFIPVQFEDDNSSDPVLVLTNKKASFGAAAILYPQMPKSIYEQVGGNYYLLPASVHEFLIVPEAAGIPKERLASMVREINEVHIAPEEVLSDDIYYFDGHNITKM